MDERKKSSILNVKKTISRSMLIAFTKQYKISLSKKTKNQQIIITSHNKENVSTSGQLSILSNTALKRVIRCEDQWWLTTNACDCVVFVNCTIKFENFNTL